jgi:predicted esterase
MDSFGSSRSSYQVCSGCGKTIANERGKVTLQRCSRCAIVRYCNRECQLKHFPQHKQVCCLLSAASDRKQSSPVYTRPLGSASTIPLSFLMEPSPDGINDNILIMLQGWGDNPAVWFRFGMNLALPRTVVVSPQGPFRIPHLDDLPPPMGWWNIACSEESCGILYEHYLEWQDSNVKDCSHHMAKQQKEELEFSMSRLDELIELLRNLYGKVEETLPSSRIFLLGFSQGGTLALHYLLRRTFRGQERLGGVIAASCAPLMLNALPPHISYSNSSSGSSGTEEKEKEKEKRQEKEKEEKGEEEKQKEKWRKLKETPTAFFTSANTDPKYNTPIALRHFRFICKDVFQLSHPVIKIEDTRERR